MYRVKIGDLLKIKNLGGRYSSYKDAFTHFGLDYYENNARIEHTDCANTIWEVRGIAMHGSFENVPIMLLYNRKFGHIIFDIETCGGYEIIKLPKFRAERNYRITLKYKVKRIKNFYG